MSDLLSPLLYVMKNEVDAFWCFSGFMDTVQTNFEFDQVQVVNISINHSSLRSFIRHLFIHFIYLSIYPLILNTFIYSSIYHLISSTFIYSSMDSFILLSIQYSSLDQFIFFYLFIFWSICYNLFVFDFSFLYTIHLGIHPFNQSTNILNKS